MYNIYILCNYVQYIYNIDTQQIISMKLRIDSFFNENPPYVFMFFKTWVSTLLLAEVLCEVIHLSIFQVFADSKLVIGEPCTCDYVSLLQ